MHADVMHSVWTTHFKAEDFVEHIKKLGISKDVNGIEDFNIDYYMNTVFVLDVSITIEEVVDVLNCMKSRKPLRIDCLINKNFIYV